MCGPKGDYVALNGGSAAAEGGRALLDEGLRRLTVVLRHPRVGVMGDLEVEALAELTVHSSVEVLLHVAVRHPRSLGESPSDRDRLVEQRVRREHSVDDAEVDGLLRIDRLRQEVVLLGLGAPDQPVEEPRAAVVAGEADLRERGGEDRAVGGVTQVAGQCERQAGAGGRAWYGGNRGLRHRPEPATRRALVETLAMHAD